MRVYACSATQRGIERLAQQRGLPVPTVEARKPEPAPESAPVVALRLVNPVVGLSAPKVVVIEFTPRTRAQKIIADMAHQHQITYADIISKSRRHHFVKARTEAIWALKDWNPSLSLPQIGRLMGGRDHTTILHALRKRGTA